MSILLSTNACGLKGDLYIPEKPASPPSPITDSTNKPEPESESQKNEQKPD
jgi:predicted small lipoprotein YifL